MQIGVATIENGMEVPQETKNRCTIWPINSALGKIFEENESTNLKDIGTQTIIAALFAIAMIWKQSNCPLMSSYLCSSTGRVFFLHFLKIFVFIFVQFNMLKGKFY